MLWLTRATDFCQQVAKGAIHTILQMSQLGGGTMWKYGGMSVKLFTVFMTVGDEELNKTICTANVLSYNESEQRCCTLQSITQCTFRAKVLLNNSVSSSEI
jgi:hypothetical protein